MNMYSILLLSSGIYCFVMMHYVSKKAGDDIIKTLRKWVRGDK